MSDIPLERARPSPPNPPAAAANHNHQPPPPPPPHARPTELLHHHFQRIIWTLSYLIWDLHASLREMYEDFFHPKAIFFYYLFLYSILISISVSFLLISALIFYHTNYLKSLPRSLPLTSILIPLTEMFFLGTTILGLPFLFILWCFSYHKLSHQPTRERIRYYFFLISFFFIPFLLLSSLVGRAILHSLHKQDKNIMSSGDALQSGAVGGALFGVVACCFMELLGMWSRRRRKVVVSVL